MMVSGGYPGHYEKGVPVEGCGSVSGTILFHAGTKIDNEGRLVTSGGRVIAASSYGESIAEAAARSYEAVDTVKFAGMYCRRDIGRDLMDA